MERRELIDGPSKWDLMLSLFDDTLRRVTFVCNIGDDSSGNYSASLGVLISAVEREDGSGESWNFKGVDNAHRFVRGYFSTKSRRGCVEIGTLEELFGGSEGSMDLLKVELHDRRAFEDREAEVRVFQGNNQIASVKMAIGFGPGADGSFYALLKITTDGQVVRP